MKQFIAISSIVAILGLATGVKLPFQVSHQAGKWESSPVLAGVSADFLRDLRALRQNVRTRGCPVNLCFAIQGTNFITANEWDRQKDFIELILAITATDEPGNYCAVQYGRSTLPISPLTQQRVPFVNAVQSSVQVGGNSVNVGSPLAYAGFQLRTRWDYPRKIVLMGEGINDIGPEPFRVARRIRREGTDICAVVVGQSNDIEALETITDDSNRVFKIAQYFDLSEVIVSIVNDVCHY